MPGTDFHSDRTQQGRHEEHDVVFDLIQTRSRVQRLEQHLSVALIEDHDDLRLDSCLREYRQGAL
jgi:hypothetical protein